MSSTNGLARTRSLRRPGVSTSQMSQHSDSTNGDESKTSSPSRLPVKPLTRSATTTTARTRAGTTGTARPLSGVFSGKTSSTHKRGAPSADQAVVSPSTSTRPPLGRPPPARKGPSPTSSVTSSSRIAPPSPGRPRTSGSPTSSTAPKPQPRGHTRTRSNVTSLTSATTLRPGPGSASNPDPAASTSTTSTSARLQTRPPRAGHARTQSATTRSATGAPSSSSTSSRAPAAASNNTSRPAFNTLQQHYSPLKSHAPKPLTSTFLAPPSPSKLPSNVALTAETSRLQSELLQLSLLHRDAGTVDAEWHASARSRLGDRFAELAAENDHLLATERAAAESRNIAALVRWGSAPEDGTNPDMALEDRIQALDEVLGGVWSLGEPSSRGSGRYARAVRGFEAWADRAAEILAAQRAGDVEVLLRDGPDENGEDGVAVVFLGELDTSWKSDCAGLVRKLQGYRRALRDLGLPDEEDEDFEQQDGGGRQSQSSLARILGGCATLVHDMLAELAIMTQIEREATRAENAWIDKMNSELLSESSETPGTKKKRAEDVALWKLVA